MSYLAKYSRTYLVGCGGYSPPEAVGEVLVDELLLVDIAEAEAGAEREEDEHADT